jgi:tetratricopeptide (TPR) repeat protein
MWRSFCLCILLVLSIAAWGQQNTSSSGQNSSNENSSSSKDSSAQSSSGSNSSSQTSSSDSQPASSSSKEAASQPGSSAAKSHSPEFDPPRSDSVNAGDLGGTPGESSSKDTQIDLSSPDDAKPRTVDSGSNPEMLKDEGTGPSNGGDIAEFHPWDPHKAAKDVEVGDFYFKRKNYRAAEERYREALYYKNNDALATYKLAICLDKLGLPNDARAEYESYLKILPNGPEAPEVQKALARLSRP